MHCIFNYACAHTSSFERILAGGKMKITKRLFFFNKVFKYVFSSPNICRLNCYGGSPILDSLDMEGLLKLTDGI